jgi:hypothetical protein
MEDDGTGDLVCERVHVDDPDIHLDCNSVPAMTGHIPWSMSILKSLPGVHAKRDKFKAFGKMRAMSRINMTTKEKDLYHHLVCIP